MLSKTIDNIDKFTERVGNSIALLNVVMVLAMCLVVGLRYLFNSSSIFLQETVMYLHAIIFMVCMGYTLKSDEHVRVDIFYQKFSSKSQAIINLAGTLLLLFPVLTFIAWYSWGYIGSAWAVKEASQEAAGIPYVYLLKSLIIVMIAFLALQGISEALKACQTLLYPGTTPKNLHKSPQDLTHG